MSTPYGPYNIARPTPRQRAAGQRRQGTAPAARTVEARQTAPRQQAPVVTARRRVQTAGTGGRRQQERQAFQLQSQTPSKVDPYFKEGTENILSPEQRAFCRCVLHVAAQQDPSCFSTRGALGKGKCYQPYAVCTASVGTQSSCYGYYAFTPQAVPGGITDDEVNGFARMIHVPVESTRGATVANIQNYLRSRGDI